jgi:uncharacterized membrane protein YhfC
MKIYSDSAVTSGDLSTVQRSVDAVDAKQTEQIQKLRLWLAASFVVNAVLALALHFL